MDTTADDFNDLYDVGTPVFFWPGWRKDEKGKDIPAMVSETSTPAWQMPGGQQVVTIKGRAGGMALSHVEVIPDYVLRHLKTSEDEDAIREAQAAQHRAETTLALVGMEIEGHGEALLKSLAPFYERQTTTCDGKCAKVEDLEEELESAKSATKVAAKLSDELLEKHLASEAKAAQLEEALASAQRRASDWQTRGEGAETAHLSVLEQHSDAVSEISRIKMESAQRQAEIDRLRGIVRLNQQQQNRNQGTFSVYQGVISDKEAQLAAADAKIEELRGMLATQHARLTVLEGDLGSKTRDYNNIEAKFVEARNSLEMARADLRVVEDEREQAYEMLDPETDIDDRVKSLPTLVEEMINKKTQLEERPHKGCQELEAGLQKKFRAAEKERDNAFRKLDELRNQVLDVVRDNVRAKPSD